MSLLSDIRNYFNRKQPVEQTTLSGPVLPTIVNTVSDPVYNQLKAERDRLNIMRVCREMYETDSRVEKAHRFYARDIVSAGFLVKTQNAEAKQIADDLQKRIDLNQILEDCVRLTSRDGDSFYEVVVNDKLDITDLSRKPTMQMRRNSNLKDQFENPSQAYWMTHQALVYEIIPPEDALFFADWQMIHARWKYEGESRYGKPMFSASTAAFKRVQDGELNVAVRRRQGGAQIRHHVVEGSPADLEAYKEENKATFGRIAAVIDLFTNKSGSVTVHQGDGNIDKIGDVTHHVATMMAASDVPMELIAYGEGLNRDILGEKKEEYEENLAQGREWLTSQIIKPALERQWLLKGILPETVDYEIIWRTAKPLTPADLRDLADALTRYKLLGVDDAVIKEMAALYLRNVDVDILKSSDKFSIDQFAQNLKGISVG